MNLEQLGITKDDLIEKIVSRFIDDLQGNGDYEDYIFNARERINTLVDQKFCESIDKEIKEIVSKIGSDTLHVAYQPVNRWGEKEGEKTTLKERLEKESLKWWSQSVDRDGKPCKSDGYGSQGTRASILVKEQMEHVLRTEVNRNLKEHIEETKKNIHAQLAQTITAYLKHYFAPV